MVGAVVVVDLRLASSVLLLLRHWERDEAQGASATLPIPHRLERLRRDSVAPVSTADAQPMCMLGAVRTTSSELLLYDLRAQSATLVVLPAPRCRLVGVC